MTLSHGDIRKPIFGTRILSVLRPPGHTEEQWAREVAEKVKDRYIRCFAKMCRRNEPTGYYERRRREREFRKKLIWKDPHEYSYKPPTKAPTRCNPRKGIHPEADLSWHPAPTTAEVPAKFHTRPVTAYGTHSLAFSAYDQKRRQDHLRLIDCNRMNAGIIVFFFQQRWSIGFLAIYVESANNDFYYYLITEHCFLFASWCFRVHRMSQGLSTS